MKKLKDGSSAYSLNEDGSHSGCDEWGVSRTKQISRAITTISMPSLSFARSTGSFLVIGILVVGGSSLLFSMNVVSQVSELFLQRQQQSNSLHSNSNPPLQQDPLKNDDDRSISTSATRPEFILHVGLPKAGSSTLQCDLRKNEIFFIQDGYEILETESCRPSKRRRWKNGIKLKYEKGGKSTYDNVVGGWSFVPHCLSQWKEEDKDMPQCWKDSYMRYARELRKEHKSVILSQETATLTSKKLLARGGTSFTSDLVKSVEGEGYRLVVFISYRPWFDWVLSALNQQMKKWEKPKRSRWPGSGGIHIPTPVDYVLRKNTAYPFTDQIINLYRNVTGVELHVYHPLFDGDLTQYVFCTIMSNATNACAEYKRAAEEETERTLQNLSKELWFDYVIVEAMSQGLIDKAQISRQLAFKYVSGQYAQNKEVLEGPYRSSLVCPSDEIYSVILDESLERERATFPEEMHSAMEEKHKQLFEQKKKKYCHVNSTKLLEDPHWRALLSNVTK